MLPSFVELPARSRPMALLGAGGRLAAYLLAVVVALASYRYVLGLPPIPPAIAANRYRTGWLFVHAGFAATALLVGTLQFGLLSRPRWTWLHRRIGQLYVCCCVVGASTGLVLAAGTSAGPVAGAGFGSLSIAWLLTTAVGWRSAVARRFADHRRWMIRSWALTLAAVSLRIYLPLSIALSLPMAIAYPTISFLCWVPNLAIAEAFLRLERRRGRH